MIHVTVVGAIPSKTERLLGYPTYVPIFAFLDANERNKSVPKHNDGSLVMAVYAGRELRNVRR